jgi:hypothetical protein
MLKTWKPRLILATLVGAVAVVGCFDFEGARDRCVDDDRCKDPTPCTPSDPNDPPDDDFMDTNCDGIDGVAAAGLFVDPVSGDNANPGTRERPLKTIRAALELLRGDAGAGITSLYLAQGSYDEDQLVLDRPVSLYGAYGGVAHNWKRRTEYTSFLDGGTVGFTVSGLKGDAGVRMEWLTMASANASTAGAPSIAMRVLNTQDLLLHHANLMAGQGAAGAQGARGDAGPDGPDGGPGTAGNGATTGSGGGATPHFCGAENHSGGPGRSGAKFTAGSTGGLGQPLTDGGTDGGIGGAAGTPIPQGQIYYCEAGPGQDGTSGSSGSPGDAGPGGGGIGELRDGTWVATPQGRGGMGTPGTAGAGGGGGGSGGACPEGEGTGTNQTAGGGGSGAGGGGGCGGLEGQGGGAGGASIALLLMDSTVRLGEVALSTRGGGQGGAGGQGGTGGLGGVGGPGGGGGSIFTGSLYMTKNYTSFGGDGGTGGNGGNGGPGGAGGGGAGGPSVGIWCWDGGVAPFAASHVTSDLGPGGTGGASQGSPGTDGLKIPYQACSPSPP